MTSKKTIKSVSYFLSFLLIIPFITGIFGLFNFDVSAATTTKRLNKGTPSVTKLTDIKNTKITNLKPGQVFILEFSFELEANISLSKVDTDGYVTLENDQFSLATNWSAESNAELTIAKNKNASNQYDVTLVKAKNQSITSDTYLSIKLLKGGDLGFSEAYEIQDIIIGEEYFQKGTTDPDSVEFTPDSAIENILVTDKDGNALDEITKDTPPFKIVITFLEFGMEEIDFDNIPDSALSVLFQDGSGFFSPKGTGGTLTPLLASSKGTPRFKAVFENISYDGSASTSITIVPRYQIDGEHKRGEAIEVKIRAAKPDKEEEEEDKLAPLKPYIIINKYSYGGEPIVAGSEFSLNISYTNTSSDIPLENIIMTVATPEDLSIASSSNSIYVPALASNGSLNHSIELKAKPDAEVGSAELTIEFKYQYIDTINKKREEVTTTEKIAIPLIQLDRFELNPIKDIPEIAFIGQSFDVTIPFVNLGNSTTRNIYAVAESKSDIEPARKNFGNLETGKTSEIDLSITPNEPGEMTVNIIVSYEHEGSEKELTSTFTIYVDEPYYPEPPPMVDEEEPKETISALTIGLIIGGGLLIATPIAYYFIKRKQQSESEIFDEDF